MMQPNFLNSFVRPLYVMVKPTGALCNLACRYCYYLEKEQLYGHGIKAMDEELLHDFIRQYISSQTMREVLFTWHGGEPLLLPISFYRKALELQEKYAGWHVIDNCIQTNGTLITDEWAEFFAENHFLVGVSIDGTQEMHDRYRHRKDGRSSWEAVMRGIEILNRHGADWNALAVVNDFNVTRPEEFYSFFKNIGCHYIQFTPIVERTPEGTLTDESITPEAWGNFLCRVFDQWVKSDIGEYFVQIFDATLANWANVAPGVCSLSPTCGDALALEHNGDLYACDHFVFPAYKLGNIKESPMLSLVNGSQQEQFRQLKQTLPRQCRECQWLKLCHGECPKNRFVADRYGEPGLNWLCKGYRQFFEHSAKAMQMMKAELDAGLPPSNIMNKL